MLIIQGFTAEQNFVFERLIKEIFATFVVSQAVNSSASLLPPAASASASPSSATSVSFAVFAPLPPASAPSASAATSAPPASPAPPASIAAIEEVEPIQEAVEMSGDPKAPCASVQAKSDDLVACLAGRLSGVSRLLGGLVGGCFGDLIEGLFERVSGASFETVFDLQGVG